MLRFGLSPSVQEGERFVSLESSSAISRELHTLRRENVELRDKYDQLRRDFQDLCAHLGVEGPGGSRSHHAVRASRQSQAEGVDIGAGNEIEAGERSEHYPSLFDDDVNMDDDPVVPSTGVTSGQPETAQAEGFYVGSAELPKMSEGSGGSHSGSVTPHSETATSPRPVPESPDVSGASGKSPGIADDESGQGQLPGQAQQTPGDGSEDARLALGPDRLSVTPPPQPSEAPPPLPVALGEISGDTPNSDREEEGGVGAYIERNVNDSQRTVPESTQASIPATPDAEAACEDISHSQNVKVPGTGAISGDASGGATPQDTTVPTATTADPAHVDDPPESRGEAEGTNPQVTSLVQSKSADEGSSQETPSQLAPGEETVSDRAQGSGSPTLPGWTTLNEATVQSGSGQEGKEVVYPAGSGAEKL
ncbi:uncharacterized protein B0H18DRAFT_959901 [Fomitopsis serialis]|uniref:uncharacterized protein n=1 Tax=Fomitopsis serialis TaxID=139415 RepID=UPI0020086541|nr:uncharacterized protein B0H18DRAFT_959901 [Neoantrodia serialis]KAH9914313.1 hypothetical protein B0H18DRAFT_959901 [Neoantrodia serialis]